MWLDSFNEMRKKSGMSLDELSEKSGVPKGTLSKITSGITKAPASSSVVSTKQPHNSGTKKVPESVENQCFRGFFHTFLSMMEKTISDCFIP